MIFLDGVGIGRRDAAANPFFAAHLPSLRSLFDGELPSLRRQHLATAAATLLPLDATLGVPGLPQSGTGQTTLLTGVNAPQLVGKHFGPHPYSTLRPVIARESIFKQLLDAGRNPYFANAYPQRFFDYLGQKRARTTATTYSCLTTGVQLLRAQNMKEETGISADITGEGWKQLGYPDMPVITPGEAGRRLARIASSHDFVLFEYWKTDHAGHSRNMAEACNALERVDTFLGGVLQGLDSRKSLLIITSDHGNIEDLSTKTHTRNPVPAILYGENHAGVARRLRERSPGGGTLAAVTPTLMEYITTDQIAFQAHTAG